MNTLDSGEARERMVKYAMTTMKLFKGISKEDLVFMMSKQFPDYMHWSFTLIINDAIHLLEKEKRISNK